MRPTRLFFAGIMLFSFLYLTTTLMPDEVHAVPKSIMTGEYPEAAGARCMDVDYKTDQTVNGTEIGTFVTSPNPQRATVVISGCTLTKSWRSMKARTRSQCRDSWI